MTSAATHHGAVFGLLVPGNSNNAYLVIRASTGRPQIEGIGIIKPDYAPVDGLYLPAMAAYECSGCKRVFP